MAASVLRDGGLVAFPTETVYGLGASILQPSALRRVFEAKGRPPTDPLIVHVSSPSGARELAAGWSDDAERLAERFWPGPLTLVVERTSAVPDEVCGGGPTVGLRMPAHPVALALIEAVGAGVAAPSANRFGRISPTEAAHVIDELEGRIDLVLDGGPTPLGVESTVVDLSGEVPRLLRPGAVTVEDLCTVLDELDVPDRIVVDESAVASGPGQLLVHYAPRTPLALVEGTDALVDELVGRLADAGVSAAAVDLADDVDTAARDLYRVLRVADVGGAELLLVAARSGAGIGRAVNDRLFRAAHGRVVTEAGADTIRRLVRLRFD